VPKRGVHLKILGSHLKGFDSNKEERASGLLTCGRAFFCGDSLPEQVWRGGFFLCGRFRREQGVGFVVRLTGFLIQINQD